MKIAFISDIHGNYPALKAVLSRIDRIGVDRVYCLGDTSGYYSEVNKCCDELRKCNIQSVMGNHDWYIATNSKCPRSQAANDCLEYQRKVLTRENKEWLSSLPAFIFEDGMFMVHGGLLNPIDEYLQPSEEYFQRIHAKYFISGHCHVPRIEKYESLDLTYCNSGSVGQPRDNNPHAGFAVMENGAFFIERVEYDIQEIKASMCEAGFAEYYTKSLFTGGRTLRD